MSELPNSTVVSVVITRETIFPTVKGFGTLLIVTDENTGPLNAGNRTKTYYTPDEVATDWPTASAAYKAATSAFSQKPSALGIKIGWRDNAEAILDEMTAIVAADNDWYGLCFTNLSVDADILDVAGWVEARIKTYAVRTNDPETENPADTTSIAYQLQQLGYDRTSTHYAQDATKYPDVAFMSRALTVDFTKANSTITMKYKKLYGIPALDVDSAALIAITGFVPGTGLDSGAGRFANAHISVGGLEFVTEGTMVSGEFFDIIHFVDWLQYQIQVNVLGALASGNKVPYTNTGAQSLVKAVDIALQVGVSNGGIAADIDPETGEPNEEYTISVQRVEDVPPAIRAQRIAPDISFEARLAGAFHYATVRGRVTV